MTKEIAASIQSRLPSNAYVKITTNLLGVNSQRFYCKIETRNGTSDFSCYRTFHGTVTARMVADHFLYLYLRFNILRNKRGRYRA